MTRKEINNIIMTGNQYGNGNKGDEFVSYKTVEWNNKTLWLIETEHPHPNIMSEVTAQAVNENGTNFKICWKCLPEWVANEYADKHVVMDWESACDWENPACVYIIDKNDCLIEWEKETDKVNYFTNHDTKETITEAKMDAMRVKEIIDFWNEMPEDGKSGFWNNDFENYLEEQRTNYVNNDFYLSDSEGNELEEYKECASAEDIADIEGSDKMEDYIF